MSAEWINAHVTPAPRTFPHWFGDLGPGDIACDEVAKRLRATTAPWGSANKLLDWFGDSSRIQRAALFDRGDFAVPPVLVVYLDFRNHDEVPGNLDVNVTRVNVAVVAESMATLSRPIAEGEASVETVLSYIKRFLAYQGTRQLNVTINGSSVQLAKNAGATFGQVSFVPQLERENSLCAWILPVFYGLGVDVAGGQIETVRTVDPNA